MATSSSYSAAASAAPSAEPLPLASEPLGSKPHVEVIITSLTSKELTHAAGYTAAIGKSAPVGELRTALLNYLGVSEEALSGLLYEGTELDNSKNLQDNNVSLPGVAARRAGKKLELYFELSALVLQREQGEIKQELEAQQRAREKEERERERREKAEEQQRREDEFLLQAETQLADYVQSHIGVTRSQFQTLLAADKHLDEPTSFLEPCSEDQTSALQRLLQGTGLHSAQVLLAFQLDHPQVRERFERARSSLAGGACPIKRRSTATATFLEGSQRDANILGQCDASINEFLLWHGTSFPAAKGICGSGFDIFFVGSATDAGFYGAGFYFADSASMSHGYGGRHAVSVNRKYSGCHVILLNRVVVGNMKEVNHIVNEEERMRMTAECLGPGGIFGPRSPFHSVLGAGNEYVCMSSHQVYPEYVVIYTVDERR